MGLCTAGSASGGTNLWLRAGESGVAKGVSKPVGVCGFAFFGANMVEGRNGQRIDWSGRKQGVSALEDGHDAHPAFAIAWDRRGEDAHIAGAVVARVPQEEMIREGWADDLAVVPVALRIFKTGESCMLGDRRLRVGEQEAILLSESGLRIETQRCTSESGESQRLGTAWAQRDRALILSCFEFVCLWPWQGRGKDTDTATSRFAESGLRGNAERAPCCLKSTIGVCQRSETGRAA